MLETVHLVIEWIALGIELLAVAVIVTAVVMLSIRRGTVRYLFHLEEAGAYQSYIHHWAGRSSWRSTSRSQPTSWEP